jgi:hypothetical protein
MPSEPPLKKDFLVVAALALCLYLPFLSRNYDLNGISEAQAIETRVSLFNPNHALYRPIGFLLYEGFRWLGYGGSAMPILQVLTALFGALGIGLAYTAFLLLAQNRVSAVAAALWWGTTWSYWYFSTDAAYIILASALSAGALATLLSRKSLCAPALAGALIALATLSWQPSVFLLPSFAMGILLIRKPISKKSGFLQICVLLASSGLVLGLSYLTIGWLAVGLKGDTAWAQWLFGYGGNRLPMWGQLGWDRTVAVRRTIVESLLPLNPRLSLGEIVGGIVESGRTALPVSTWTTLLLATTTLAMIVYQIAKRQSVLPLFFWSLLSYALFLPFIVWWDPFESKWFVLPNLFLAGVIAVAFSSYSKTWISPGKSV